MRCTNTRNALGNISEVFAPNGRPSDTFRTILEEVPNGELALELYRKFENEQFQEWFMDGGKYDANGDPKVYKSDDGLYVERADKERRFLTDISVDFNQRFIDYIETVNVRENPEASGYIVGDQNKEVKHRITHKVQAFNQSIYGKKQKDAMEPTYADMGTIVHAYMEFLVSSMFKKEATDLNTISNKVRNLLSDKKDQDGNNIFDKYDNSVYELDKEQFKSLHKLASKLGSDIYNKAKERDGIYELFPELTIYDPVKDIAGTIDLMVLHGDGSVAIYDYKTMYNLFAFDEDEGKYIKNKDIHYNKQTGYSIQIKEQQRILREYYGVDKFHESRIIPIHANLKKEDGKEVAEFSFFKTDYEGIEDSIFKPIPVANELTEDPNLNHLLTLLHRKQDELRSKISKSRSTNQLKTDMEEELLRVTNLLQSILIDGDIAKLYDQVTNVITYLEDIVKDNSDITPEIDEAISNNLNLLQYYQNLADIATNLDDRINEKSYEIATLASRIKNVSNDIIKYLSDKYAKKYETTFDNPILEASKVEITKFKSDLEGGIFRVFDAISSELVQNTTIESDKYYNWAVDFEKRAGKNLESIFQKILNPNDKHLVNKYDKAFYEYLDRVIANKDVEALNNNFEVKPNWEENFNRMKQNKIIKLETLGLVDKEGRPLTDEGKHELDLFYKRFDLKHSATAVFNPINKKWFLPKDKKKYHTPEYLNIETDQLASELYDKLVELNNEAIRHGIDVKGNFLPSIYKSFSEQLHDKQFLKALTPNILRDISDMDLEGQHIKSEESGLEIPIFYKAPVFTKDDNAELEALKKKGKRMTEDEATIYQALKERKDNSINVEDKSTDILTNMVTWAKMIYNYKNAKLIESTYKNLTYLMENQEQVLKDSKGKPKYDTDLEKLITGKGNATNKEILENLGKAYIYGDKNQGTDRIIEVFNTQISTKRILLLVKKILSAKALGLNWLSAAGNGINAYINGVIYGKGGQYYRSEDFEFGKKLLQVDGKKTGAIIEYLNVHDPNWNLGKASKITKLGVSKHFRFDNLFVMLKFGEKLTSVPLQIAMLKYTGLDSNGNIVRLDRLPEGSKNIFEMINYDDGKISIPGLSTDQFFELRKYIASVDRSVRGSTAEEDIHALSTTLWGNIILQFRGWVVPTARTRFKSMHKNNITGEYEIGRYNSFFSDLKGILVADTAESKFLTLNKIAADVMLGGIYKSIKVGDTSLDAAYEKLYENYKERKRHLPQSKLASFDQFKEAKQRKFREAVVELRAILGTLLAMSLMGLDWDDDGEDDYKAWWLTRRGMEVMERAVTELTFYCNPNAFDKFIQKPIPLISLIGDMYKLIGNIIDETTDNIFGEDSKHDARGWFYETSRWIPGLNQGIKYSADLLRDERSLPKQGSREIQIFD